MKSHMKSQMNSDINSHINGNTNGHRKRHTSIVIATLAVICVTTGAMAMAGGGNSKLGDRMVNRITERLDLNEQQISTLQSLQAEIRETRELMRGDSSADIQNLKDIVTAETFDQGAALEMITARTTALQAQGPVLVSATAMFLDGLSSEQKQILNEQMERFGDRRGRRH